MKFPVLSLVVVFVIVWYWPESCLAGDSTDVSVAQKAVQKDPIQKLTPTQKPVPTQKQIQKTPVQKEVIQKECCGPCCHPLKHRFRLRHRIVIRERGRILPAYRARVHVRVPGCLVCVGGGCCH